MVALYEDREFLDCLPHLETTMSHVVSFEVDFRGRVQEPFTRLTYAASTRTCLRHCSSTGTSHRNVDFTNTWYVFWR